MHQRFSVRMAACAATLAAFTFGVSQADAQYSTIGAPYGSEDSHQEIFQNLYGGNWSASGLDFTSDTGITATRVSDDNDQLIAPNVFNSVNAEAVFAGLSHSFGYFEGVAGGSFTELFNVSGDGYAVSGSASNVDLSAGLFRWAISSPGGTYTSQDSDNAGGNDHFITYVLSGTGIPAGTMLLFMEDLTNPPADWDYNDLVVRVTVVPTPAAVAPGMLLLGALGLARRRRQRN